MRRAGVNTYWYIHCRTIYVVSNCILYFVKMSIFVSDIELILVDVFVRIYCTYCVFIRLINVHKIDHQYSAYELYTMSELSNLDTVLL